METKQIQADSDEPIRQHILFNGIMLFFLFSLIAIGSMSLAFTAEFGIDGWKQINRNAFAQGVIEPFRAQEDLVKEALEIDEDVVLPTDGFFQYGLKIFRESIAELFTFDSSDKEELNVRLIDERAKEIAILDARGEDIPDGVIKNYADRIDRAEKFISLTSDSNESIDTRTVVRTALELHKTRFLDRIEALQDKPSDSVLSRVVSDFGDRIQSIIDRIDQDEIAIVKNTIPIIKQKQANIRIAEMAFDIDTINREMRELEEIDDKLNRLALARLCSEPIKTLSLNTFDDVVKLCPIAKLMENEIKDEFGG